jgi:hypothetical protein
MGLIRRIIGPLICGATGHVYGSTKTTFYPAPDGLGWAATSATCKFCGHNTSRWVPWPSR